MGIGEDIFDTGPIEKAIEQQTADHSALKQRVDALENRPTAKVSAAPTPSGGPGGIFDCGDRMTGSDIFDMGARV